MSSNHFQILFAHRSRHILSLWRQSHELAYSGRIYEEVINQLQTSLNDEKNRRQDLILEGQKELTANLNFSKELDKKLSALNVKLKENSSVLDSPVNSFLQSIKAIISNARDLDQIKNSLSEQEKIHSQLSADANKEKALTNEHQSKLLSLKDPLKDLEFAITFIKNEKITMTKLEKTIYLELLNEVIKFCTLRQERALFKSLQLLPQYEELAISIQQIRQLHAAISPAQNEIFFLDLPEPKSFSESCQGIFTSKSYSINKSLNMRGSGSHHRKVGSGDDSRWKEIDIKFAGSTYAKAKLKQKTCEPMQVGAILYKQAIAEMSQKRKKSTTPKNRAETILMRNLAEQVLKTLSSS